MFRLTETVSPGIVVVVVQLNTPRESYSSFPVQLRKKAYSIAAQTSQPVLVLESSQFVRPLPVVIIPLLLAQPPPPLTSISQRSAAKPNRTAAVEIQGVLADA